MCALLPTVKGPYKGEEAKFRKFFSARLQTLHFTRTPSSITLVRRITTALTFPSQFEYEKIKKNPFE